MKFNRYILFRCTVRGDRLLTGFIRDVKELGASDIEVDEEERRVTFRVSADKYISLGEVAGRYVKIGYYEVRSTSYRVKIRDLRGLIDSLKEASVAFERAESSRGPRLVFLLSARERPVLGEASPERGGYIFRLRALRSNVNVKVLDLLTVPASLYTFYYDYSRFREDVEDKLTALKEAEGRVRKTLNTILPV